MNETTETAIDTATPVATPELPPADPQRDANGRYHLHGAAFAELTAREHEVAHYLILGWRNAEIAKELDISVKTVDTHRGHILRKLKLNNNVALVRLVIEAGTYR